MARSSTSSEPTAPKRPRSSPAADTLEEENKFYSAFAKTFLVARAEMVASDKVQSLPAGDKLKWDQFLVSGSHRIARRHRAVSAPAALRVLTPGAGAPQMQAQAERAALGLQNKVKGGPAFISHLCEDPMFEGEKHTNFSHGFKYAGPRPDPFAALPW
jgi:hypothetical protein